MARQQFPSVANDFADVVSFLKDNGLYPKPCPGSFVATARRLHRAVFSLTLWKFRLKGIPEHGQFFVEEIASDAIQIIPHSILGFGKTPRLLIRGIIENALRHIYFSDHPIEFKRMNRDARWYLMSEELFGYPGIHDGLMDLEPKFDAVNRLKTLYSELSATVHGRQVKDLQMCSSLSDIKFSERMFERQVAEVERCTASANFLLAAFHSDRFSAFDREDRRVILASMPAKARRVLSGLE